MKWTKQLHIFSLVLFFIGFETSNGQFSLDHYTNADVYAVLGIDSVKVYVEDTDSKLTLEQSYIHNELGVEIENRRDFQDFSFTYIYNEKGLQTSGFMIPFGEDFYERDTLIYNDSDQLIAKITYNIDGEETCRSEYEYEGDQLIKDTYFVGGTASTVSTYTYSEDGKTETQERYFRGSSEFWISEKNEDGHIISFTVKDEEMNTKVLHLFEYVEGLQVKWTVLRNGIEPSWVIHSYYDNQQLLTHTESVSDFTSNDESSGEIKKRVYQYTYH